MHGGFCLVQSYLYLLGMQVQAASDAADSCQCALYCTVAGVSVPPSLPQQASLHLIINGLGGEVQPVTEEEPYIVSLENSTSPSHHHQMSTVQA